MEIIKNVVGPALVVKPQGRLNSDSVGVLEEVLEYSLGKSPNLLIDFSQLDYISSAGLRVILKTSKNMKAAGGKFVLCNMKDYVYEVFEISGLTNLIRIYRTQEEALASIDA